MFCWRRECFGTFFLIMYFWPCVHARIRICSYPQTFYCGYNFTRPHVYNLLRSRQTTRTCIRIRSEFDTKMFKSLIGHACENKLRQLPWERDHFHVIVFKSLQLQCAFSSDTYGRKPLPQ